MHKLPGDKIRKGLLVFWVIFSGFVTACIMGGGILVVIASNGAGAGMFVVIGVVWVALAWVIFAGLRKAKPRADVHEKSLEATILEKGKVRTGLGEYDSVEYYAIVELADGTRRRLSLWHRQAYIALPEKRRGELFYREVKGDMAFRRFEVRDEPPGPQPPPIRPPLTRGEWREGNVRLKTPILWVFAVLLCVVEALSLDNAKLAFLVGLAILAACGLAILLLAMRREKALDALPTQQNRATVIDKRQGMNTVFYMAFACTDGTVKKAAVPRHLYDKFVRGDKGDLTYRKWKKQIIAIDFVRDRRQLSE